jgi:prevent-host-death family protein
MRRIGIRELRQNASQYIRLVKQGETIEVTERGVLVAVLAPPPREPERKKTRSEELIEQGILIAGTQDWASWKPLPARPGERTLSEVLQEMRDEDDR